MPQRNECVKIPGGVLVACMTKTNRPHSLQYMSTYMIRSRPLKRASFLNLR